MTIDSLRRHAVNVVCAVGALLGLAGLATEYFAQGALGLASALTLACAAMLLATWLIARDSQMFRYTAVSVLMAQVMALLIAGRGYPWQMDLHMAFFAALALCALMYDIRAIILGTVLVALHHLIVGLSLETFVFYGGGSLGRVALHAVILLTEAAGLIWLTLTTERLLTLADNKTAEAAIEAQKVQAMADETASERAHNQDRHRTMLVQLQSAMGGVVEAASRGDFSQRVEGAFADAELNSLAGGINNLVASMDRGLSGTVEVLDALAAADLSRRVTGEHEGAFGALKDNTNAVADKLGEIVDRLRTTSQSLKTATGEMLAGASDLSTRTTRQAATIGETSTAVVQLATAVQQNAARAREAREVAGMVSRTADEGGTVVAEANEAMDRITASSGKISSIIGLIDDIAFQTNLLALNASVEAARAGEAGRGFAVVAVEVRRLAQSAAKASAEVKLLVEQSAGDVRGGSRLVAEAAAKLEAMLAAARHSNELMDGIARESGEQASAIDEVSNAMRELDEVTQHNAALVEETNATIAQTEAQASALDRIVDLFTLSAPSDALSTGKRRQMRAAYATDGNTVLKEEWSEF